jgi:hypothetical protein
MLPAAVEVVERARKEITVESPRVRVKGTLQGVDGSAAVQAGTPIDIIGEDGSFYLVSCILSGRETIGQLAKSNVSLQSMESWVLVELPGGAEGWVAEERVSK